LGDPVTDSFTSPAKPVELVTVTFAEPDPPAEKLNEETSVLTAKSLVTVTVTVTV
jgi:hypothetical protein